MVLLGVSGPSLQKPRIVLSVMSPVAPSNHLQIVPPALGSDDIVCRAKALYTCVFQWHLFGAFADTRTDTGSAGDPNEISFAEGELLDILDNTGEWWLARRAGGTVGSEYPFAAETPDFTERYIPSCSFKYPPNCP